MNDGNMILAIISLIGVIATVTLVAADRWRHRTKPSGSPKVSVHRMSRDRMSRDRMSRDRMSRDKMSRASPSRRPRPSISHCRRSNSRR